MKLLLERMPNRIFIAISGILLGLSIVFAEIGIISYVALLPFAFALYKRSEDGEYNFKRSYIDGLIFYMCFDLVALHWFFYFYPLDFLGFTKLQALGVVLFAWVGLSLLQCVFSAFAFVFIARFSKAEMCKKNPILLAPFAAAMFTVNEWSQTFTWAGVPWSRISISQAEMPIMMQSASLFGSYFLTFIVVLVNFLIAYALLHLEKRKLATICALAVFFGNVLVGTVLYFVPTVDEGRSIKVAAIQGNLESQSNIGKPYGEIFDIYEAQTIEAVKRGAELVIYPEGTFPMDVNSYIKKTDGSYSSIKSFLSDLSVEQNITLVVGTCIDDKEDDCDYNSISVFYPNGKSNINAYAKRRPVPFGEYVPMREAIEFAFPVLAQLNYLASDITPGGKSTVFDITSNNETIRVGALICFDSIYDELGIDSSRVGAEMLIIPSNDSWFYDSRALDMHHAQNILRAVEQGRYTVSCGNTGITSIVSDKGNVICDIPIYTEGYVFGTVYASNNRTLYSYIGNAFVYLCLIAVVRPLACDEFSKRKTQK